jgi:hypothetical protein
MTQRWLAYPAVAAASSLAAAVLTTVAGMEPGAGTLAVGLLPLLVPALWGLSWVVVPVPRLQLAVAGGTAVLIVLLGGWAVGIQFGAYLASGLLIGWTLDAGRRWDLVLGLGALPLAGLMLWVALAVPMGEMIDEYGQQLESAAEANRLAGLDEAARTAAVAEYRRMVAGTVTVLHVTWPGLFALGLLGQSGIVVLLTRGLGGLLRSGWRRRPLPPFSRWEVPFYTVLVLVLGLALIVLRRPGLREVGYNLVLVAAGLLSVQGLAVQVHVLGKVLPSWGRILFWTVAAVFMHLLIMASSVILGLVDQWLHLRDLAPRPGGPPQA